MNSFKHFSGSKNEPTRNASNRPSSFKAFEIVIDGFDLGQLIDPNGFFRFLQHFSTERLTLKVIEHGFDEIIKADLELTDTNEDLIKKGMFSRKNQMTEKWRISEIDF